MGSTNELALEKFQNLLAFLPPMKFQKVRDHDFYRSGEPSVNAEQARQKDRITPVAGAGVIVQSTKP